MSVIRTYVTAKLHGITVTAANVNYRGSVTIGAALMNEVGIEPYEQVHVVNLNSGERWITYAIPGSGPIFELNGGGARCGVIGDRCVVMTYGQAEQAPGAKVLEIADDNSVVRACEYRTFYPETPDEKIIGVVAYQ